jgi:Asparagine synthase (glutamine-hydrolyzing)
MCGICGIVNFDGQPVSDNSISKMMQLIKHRGPNDEGKYVEENLGMGFVRLSIIDLSSKGHQPMLDKSGRYSITHNGEVYNYLEIKNTLLKKGYTFKSGTDTEVILNSYIEWGEDCLHKFNGMWSFVIYDKIEKSLFISRDRFGIKPFYYYYDKK